MRPEYNDKFIEAHLLGPVAFVEQPRQPIFRTLLNLYTVLKKAFELARVYKITFDNRIGIAIAELFCRKASLPCNIIMTILDSNQINCVSSLG